MRALLSCCREAVSIVLFSGCKPTCSVFALCRVNRTHRRVRKSRAESFREHQRLTSAYFSVEEHGEMSVETVDALEVYGNALLKNAIASSAVLGGPAATANTGVTEPAAKKSKESKSTWMIWCYKVQSDACFNSTCCRLDQQSRSFQRTSQPSKLRLPFRR